jgi:BirA family biotin operon repressor/biotin-[acetyl-CoA-carboxylase] ligase
VNARVALALRRARGEARSAEALAEAAGVSPEAVVSAVEALGKRGYRIESHPIQGFRLLAAPDNLLEDEVACNLATERIGRTIRCVDEATSTNDLAWQAVERDGTGADGLAVFAEYQTAGRGRRSNRWRAPRHTSVLCSVVLIGPPGGGEGGAVLTRGASLAAAEAVEAETGLDVGLRWPNDLVVDDRKVGGILVEARPGRTDPGTAVVGVGVNGTQRPAAFPAEIRDGVTSLASEGVRVDRTLLARRLLERLDAVVREMGVAGRAETVRRAAVDRCRTLGRRITLTDGTETVTGEVVDLDPDYALLLRLAGGTIRRFAAMTTHVVSQGTGG